MQAFMKLNTDRVSFLVAKSKSAMKSIEKWLNLKIDCVYLATSLDLDTFKVDTGR